MKFSASQLKAWQDCMLQAKYIYLDAKPQPSGSAAVFGSAVHESIDGFHKGDSEDVAVQKFLRFMEQNEPDYWNRRTTLTGYLDQGERMIREYIKAREWADSDVIASELRFMVDIGEHQVSGIVDFLELPHDHSSLNIVDLKTGRRPILDSLYLNIQMTLYHYASYQKEFWCGHPDEPDKYQGFEEGEDLFDYFREIERKAYWYDLKKNEAIYAGPRSSKDFGRLYRLIEQVARAIEYEVYVPAINENTCTWCSFQDICPVYVEHDGEA